MTDKLGRDWCKHKSETLEAHLEALKQIHSLMERRYYVPPEVREKLKKACELIDGVSSSLWDIADGGTGE